jgi:type VI secretion system VasD/TssJ family lipoprotein
MHKIMLLSGLLLLSGCSSIVDLATKTVEVWMDPSIPVGEPEDQPSTMTLSMNASANVNPNIYNDNELVSPEEVAEPPVEDQETPVLDEAAFLAEVYQEIMSDPPPISEDIPSVDDILRIPDPPKLETAVEAVFDSVEEIAVDGAKKADASPEPEATPIAFKVIQLKDNSLFLQADFESLFADLESVLGTTYLAHDDYTLMPTEFKFIEPFALQEETRYVAVIAAYSDYANKEWKTFVKVKSKGSEYSLLLYFDEAQVSVKKQEL